MNNAIRSPQSWLAIVLVGSAAAALPACTSHPSPAVTTTTVVVTPPPTSTAATTPGSPPATPTPTSSGVAGPGECATSALKVSIGQSQGAAGTIYYNIDFTNISNSTCVLQGYPGVSLVSAGSNAGSQIGSDAKRTSLRPAKPITVAPGQTANALLGILQAAFVTSNCQPVTAHWMKVFPPDQFAAAYVKFTTQTCASTSKPTMHIAAIAAGA